LEAKRIEADLLEKDTEIALLKEAILDMQKLLKSPEKLAGLSKTFWKPLRIIDRI